MAAKYGKYHWNDWNDATAYATWARTEFTATATVGDPYQGSQWYIRNTGQ